MTFRLLCFLDVGTPVKSGIYFHRTPSSTSTATKPSTTPTTQQTPSVPLASPSQRAKFTFTIPTKNKGPKTDLSKAKVESKELREKDVKTEDRDKLSSPVTENARSELKSPITSSVKNPETGTESGTTQRAAKPDTSQKEKPNEPTIESFPLKKEEKEKSVLPSKKPRPPPLFIPRPVVQGKGTPMSASRLPAMFGLLDFMIHFCNVLSHFWCHIKQDLNKE